MVKDSNGEVSASVDETNRVRALLGLKPLRGTTNAVPPRPPSTPQPLEPAAGQVAGPMLPSAGAPTARVADAASAPVVTQPAGGTEAGVGAEAVLALRLSRYTDARPQWR